LKKAIYSGAFIILLLSLFYLVINSTFFVNKISQKYLPKYQLYYKKISGNPLSGITIEGLRFKDRPLAKSLAIRINPYRLLDGTLAVSKLHFLDVNPLTLEEMIKEFSTNKKDKKKESNLPFAVELNDIKFTTLPFKKFDIKIKRAILSIKSLRLSTQVEVGDISFEAKSSVGEIFLLGSFEDDLLKLKKLTLKNLDLNAILGVFKSNLKTKKNGKKASEKKFALKKLEIDSFSISTLPFKYQNIKLNSLLLAGKSLKVDLESKKVLSAKISGIVDSNFGNLKFISKIDQNLLDIKKLFLSSVDINLILAFNKEKKSNKNSPKASDKKEIPFLPKLILVENLKVDTKVFKKDKFITKKLLLSGENILLENFDSKKGELLLKLDSNILKAKVRAKLKEDFSLEIYDSFAKIKNQAIAIFKLPIRANSLSAIVFKGKVSKERLKIYGGFKAKNLLKDKSAPKIDLKGVVFAFGGNFKDKKGLVLKSKAKISLKDLTTLKAELFFNLKSKKFILKAFSSPLKLKDKKLSKELGKIFLKAVGDDKTIKANLSSKLFEAKLKSNDFKRGKLLLKSRRKIYLKKFVKLPKELLGAYLKVEASSNINFKNPRPFLVNLKLLSNLIDFKGKLTQNKSLSINGIVKVPKNTILRKMDKNIKLYSFNNLKLSISKNKKTILLKAQNSLIKLNLKKIDTKTKLRVNFAKNQINLEGDINKTIKGKIHIVSILNFLNDIRKFYKLSPINLDGSLDLALEIKKLKEVYLSINSKKIKIKSEDKKSSKIVKNLKAVILKNQEKVLIKNYSLEFEKMKFFATKKSSLELKKDKTLIKEFWVNDSLKLTGVVLPKQKRTSLKATSNSFTLKSDILDAKIATDLKIDILDKKISIDGKITILGGVVKYKIQNKRYVTDSDIIILQEQKSKKDKNRNLKLYILVNTKAPLIFKNKDLMVKLKPNLTISKKYSKELKILGTVDLLKGGYYKFENKKFVLQKSAIYFTGSASNPLLNIHLILRRYNKTIKIYIAGRASEPSLNFTSSPPMTREQILAYILFDDENAINSSNMFSALGGALAKSVLRNMGIKIDSMIIKSNGFEVGKKISKKVTIIYDQSDEPKAILRIEHSHKFETDISVGESSQSVDITYKKEF